MNCPLCKSPMRLIGYKGTGHSLYQCPCGKVWEIKEHEEDEEPE